MEQEKKKDKFKVEFWRKWALLFEQKEKILFQQTKAFPPSNLIIQDSLREKIIT
jgi:hypothetical protein